MEIVVEEAGERLDRWLSQRLDISRNQIQLYLKQGYILLNQKKAKSSHKLVVGDRLFVTIPSPPQTAVLPENIPLDIRYMDDEVIVVNKPSGMVVHPANGHPSGTLTNAIVHLIQEDTGAPLRPGIVHRIDKGTSGLLVIARTPKTLSFLAEQFAAHTITRSYLALVWGRPKAEADWIDAPLGRSKKDRKKIAIIEDGKRARTHYQSIASSNTNPTISLLRCKLETGRTHQIRVHLRSKGHALLCDPMYGLRSPPKVGQRLLKQIEHQLLHAETLGFEHPQKGYIEFSAEPPKDFQTVLHWLKFSL